MSRLERAWQIDVEDKRSLLLSRNRDDFKDDDFGEVRILSDDISAITDNSVF